MRHVLALDKTDLCVCVCVHESVCVCVSLFALFSAGQTPPQLPFLHLQVSIAMLTREKLAN